MKFQNSLAIVLVMSLSFFSGCAKAPVSEKTIEQLEKEASKMVIVDLRERAEFYAKELKAQRQEVSKITNEMKGLSVKEIFGSKGNSFKKRLWKVQDKANAFLDRYRIYVSKLLEKGADISEMELK